MTGAAPIIISLLASRDADGQSPRCQSQRCRVAPPGHTGSITVDQKNLVNSIGASY